MMGIDEFNVSTEAHTITFEPLPKRKPVLHTVKNSDTPGRVSPANVPCPPVEGDQISEGLIMGPNRTPTSLQSKALRSQDCH